MNKKNNKPEDTGKNLIAYFDQQVLASYINEPDKYDVITDYFSGRVSTTDKYFKKLSQLKKEDEYINVRFGYRTLISGDLAIFAFLPDLCEDSKNHIQQWSGFLLENPQWPKKIDKRFEMWKDVYLKGSWNCDNLITKKIYDLCSLINGLLSEVLGRKFFKSGNLKRITFPSAQNTHSYQDAHANLNRYLIDEMDKKTIALISKHLGLNHEMIGNEKLNALKEILPELRTSNNFNKTIEILRRQRGKSVHNVRKPATYFKAFEQFSKDLELVHKGYKELLRILERKFKVSSKRAKIRNNAKEGLPLIVNPPEPYNSINQARFMKGKKIVKVEYGQKESHEMVHESEAIIITFSDGSMLGIKTGSNVKNMISQSCKKAKPADFHVGFMLHWVPSLKNPLKKIN